MKIISKLPLLTAAILAVCSTTANAASVQLKVTVNNISPSGGVTLTPVWVGFHDGNFDTYDLGAPTSAALERLVEDGNVAPLSASFTATAGGQQGVVFGDTPPLIMPGTSGSSMITIDDSNNFFSYASMIVPSNDYFVANGDPTAHDISSLLNGAISQFSFNIGLPGTVNDAGTEMNDFATSAGNPLFAGLPAGQSGPNEGVNENGVVTLVANPYAGFDNTPVGLDLSDLDFNQYTSGIAEITITVVPVPAALPLAASGFALLFGMGRSRKKAAGA